MCSVSEGVCCSLVWDEAWKVGWGRAVGGLEWQAEQTSGAVFGTMVLRTCSVCVCVCVLHVRVQTQAPGEALGGDLSSFGPV